MKLNITAVGDISFNGMYHNLVAQKADLDLFRHVKPFLNADLLIGNLESPLTMAPAPHPPWRYRLRGNPAFAPVLKSAGFQVLTLGNNHAMDFGWTGLQQTMELLEKSGIMHVGAGANLSEARKPLILRVEDCDVAIFSYCSVPVDAELYASTTMPGVCWADPDRMVEDVALVKGPNNIVVVCLHWGDEHLYLPSPGQRAIAKKLINAGADLILGNHSHVFQPMEKLGRSLVAYSLGNFVFSSDMWNGSNQAGEAFSMRMTLRERHRKSAIFKVQVTQNGIENTTLIPTYIEPGKAIRPGSSSQHMRELQRADHDLKSPLYRSKWASQVLASRMFNRLAHYFPNGFSWHTFARMRPRHCRALVKAALGSLKR